MKRCDVDKTESNQTQEGMEPKHRPAVAKEGIETKPYGKIAMSLRRDMGETSGRA